MQKIKEQCPIDMGQGIVMTNVDFYEKEKILEYVISIDGVESIDQDGVQQMKEVIVEELANNSSFLSNVSVKMIPLSVHIYGCCREQACRDHNQ